MENEAAVAEKLSRVQKFRKWEAENNTRLFGGALFMLLLFMLAVYGAGVFLSYKPKTFYEFVDPGGMLLVFSVAFGVVIWCFGSVYAKVGRLEKSLSWLTGASLGGLRKINESIENGGMDRQNSIDIADKLWPWGKHHTEALGHLEAAAIRYWAFYDPADPSTAPTNEDVADWLQEVRGVSKDRARSIASILRADGLPAGRRR